MLHFEDRLSMIFRDDSKYPSDPSNSYERNYALLPLSIRNQIIPSRMPLLNGPSAPFRLDTLPNFHNLLTYNLPTSSPHNHVSPLLHPTNRPLNPPLPLPLPLPHPNNPPPHHPLAPQPPPFHPARRALHHPHRHPLRPAPHRQRALRQLVHGALFKSRERLFQIDGWALGGVGV